MPAPPALLLAIVFDPRRLPHWDGMIHKVRVAAQFEKDLLLMHIQLKGFDDLLRSSAHRFFSLFPVAPRDLSLIYGYRQYEDGSYIVAFRSVVHSLVLLSHPSFP